MDEDKYLATDPSPWRRPSIPVPPAPEVPNKEVSKDNKEEYERGHQRVKGERGLRSGSGLSSSSAPGKVDLRRVLGTKRQRNPTLTIKSTISDNRTGDIQQQLLLALDKGPKDCLLGLKASAVSDGTQRETSIRVVKSRTKVGRSAAIQALNDHDDDIENAVWYLKQTQAIPADASEDFRTQFRLDAAADYIQSKRGKKGVTSSSKAAEERAPNPPITRSTPDPPLENLSLDAGWPMKY
ncbi:Fc.00g002390.m01.CDS01 [Cosmosporella sp. VM-42]